MSDHNKQSNPNLLVRTSGESRLSDFLLWQSRYSVTHFTKVLWPDFGFNHLMAAIFHYQSKMYYVSEILELSNNTEDKSTSAFENDCTNLEKKNRISRFLELLDSSKFCSLNKTIKSNHAIDESQILQTMNSFSDNKGL